MDSHSTRGSKGDFDSIVVHLRDAAEEFVGSQEDRLEFIELSVFGEAGAGDLDEVSNVVLWRGTLAFGSLLCHCNMTADKLGLDRIPKSIGYHVRTKGNSGDNNSFFDSKSKMNAECMRGDVPRSINTGINYYLHRGESGQPVQSLS